MENIFFQKPEFPAMFQIGGCIPLPISDSSHKYIIRSNISGRLHQNIDPLLKHSFKMRNPKPTSIKRHRKTVLIVVKPILSV